ncbi:MAG TPA: polysaccharide deacetylase family protein [Solirubrobacteraceae bacterium]|nr:polysaccharide deacetylase family protein [Solirubrobacteraceae bacterium]
MSGEADERDLDGERRRARRAARRRELARRRRRAFAGLSLLLVAGAVVAVALASGGGSGGSSRSAGNGAANGSGHAANSRAPGGSSRAGAPTNAAHGTVTGAPTGRPGSERVPILMYHVINPPPAGAPFPGLYVQPSEFAAQMQALASAGYHAITQDQMWAYWKRGVIPLPAGQKPIVVSFDNGYQSQYTNALPVLRRLGWVGDENIQLTGLPPSQGGLSQAQIKGLVTAGWELDTQGISHADLITLNATQLAEQVAGSRKTIQQRYGVPVNWFCYPSGHYNATVIAAVKSAGYTGSTTVVPGWAAPESDPYRLPRLRVLGGTSPESLLSELQSIRNDPPPPSSYSG